MCLVKSLYGLSEIKHRQWTFQRELILLRQNICFVDALNRKYRFFLSFLNLYIPTIAVPFGNLEHEQRKNRSPDTAETDMGRFMKMPDLNTRFAIAVFTCGVVGAPSAVTAKIEEVILTAQKRSQNVQDVPAALTVLLASGHFIPTADGSGVGLFVWFSVSAAVPFMSNQADSVCVVHEHGACVFVAAASLHAAALEHHFSETRL